METQMRQPFCGLPLDTTSIPQYRLNLENKHRSNLFPWNGQFSPQLVEVLLATYAPQNSFVLDPFVGSGTVLCEAGRMGFSAFGAEINPAALKMAQAYRFINASATRRERVVQEVERALDDLPDDSTSLFNLVTATDSRATPCKIALRDRVLAVADPDARSLLETLAVLLDYKDDSISSQAIFASWKRLRRTVIDLPYTPHPINLVNCDARQLSLSAAAVDIVITSPPYINVFNYHQQYRRSVEGMGWNLLKVAKSEIGSNRKHRQNRFLTVTQYCLDMTDALTELRRVCKDGASVVIVVGRESNVRKTNFYNGAIVADLATKCAGFALPSRQERVFTNRFGTRIIEDILHFVVQKSGALVETPLRVANDALADAMSRAPSESTSDLRDALARIDEVERSPIYTSAESPVARQAAFK